VKILRASQHLLFAFLGIALASPMTLAQGPLPNAAAIDEFLDGAIADTHIPGLVALAVDKDSVLYARASGYRSEANNVPMSMDTIFNIASMTKPVATTAIMMLVEEGKLSLDDPIAKYLPEFADRPVLASFNAADGSYTTRPAANVLTIRHLLSHSSGLAYGFGSDTMTRLSAANPGPNAPTLPLLFDPGTAWAYSGGIAVVGRVLEQIEGKTLDVFLQERLFGPLGMNETGYAVPSDRNGRVAATYNVTENGLAENPVAANVRSNVSADGGLYSTAADYVHFIQMILNDGAAPDGTRLLEAESVRVLTSNHLGEVRVSLQDEPTPALARAFPLGAGRDGFGLGFQVTGEHDDPNQRQPGSLSWAGIFNTEFWIDPATGVGADDAVPAVLRSGRDRDADRLRTAALRGTAPGRALISADGLSLSGRADRDHALPEQHGEHRGQRDAVPAEKREPVAIEIADEPLDRERG
jgi:methyl acetate hydrolase